MEKIADVTGVLCISVFVMGLFYQLGGFEKTARIIRFVVALCIISTAFNCFKNSEHILFSDDINIKGAKYDYDTEFYNSVISETEIELEKIIKTRLYEKNISYKEVDVHILEQNSLVAAEEVVIVCDDIYTEAVYDSIKDMITENTKVFIGE